MGNLIRWVLVVLVAVVVWSLYEVRTAPMVDPSSCPWPKVRNGREKCGGPCRRGPLPCAPPDAGAAVT